MRRSVLDAVFSHLSTATHALGRDPVNREDSLVPQPNVARACLRVMFHLHIHLQKFKCFAITRYHPQKRYAPPLPQNKLSYDAALLFSLSAIIYRGHTPLSFRLIFFKIYRRYYLIYEIIFFNKTLSLQHILLFFQPLLTLNLIL